MGSTQSRGTLGGASQPVRGQRWPVKAAGTLMLLIVILTYVSRHSVHCFAHERWAFDLQSPLLPVSKRSWTILFPNNFESFGPRTRSALEEHWWTSGHTTENVCVHTHISKWENKLEYLFTSREDGAYTEVLQVVQYKAPSGSCGTEAPVGRAVPVRVLFWQSSSTFEHCRRRPQQCDHRRDASAFQ